MRTVLQFICEDGSVFKSSTAEALEESLTFREMVSGLRDLMDQSETLSVVTDDGLGVIVRRDRLTRIELFQQEEA